jgi:hypothetical protein
MKKISVILILLVALFAAVCHAEEITTSGNMAVEDIKHVNSILGRTDYSNLTAVGGTYEIRAVRGELVIITYVVNCKTKEGGAAVARIRVTLENPEPNPFNFKIIDVQKKQ